jgi:hypothetical protein
METDDFEEPNCRLLVILLVASSLGIPEYSRSTRRRSNQAVEISCFQGPINPNQGFLLLLA